MQKSIIVLGIGRFGHAVATRLSEKGAYITAVDQNYEIIERIADQVSTAIQADITDSMSIKSLGLSNYDVAIIGIGSDIEASIVASLFAKDYGVEKVIAKASSKTHARILDKIGVDQIVFPEVDTAENLSRSLISTHILDYIKLSDEISVIEMRAKDKWIGKSILDLDFRNKYQLNIIAIKSKNNVIVDFDANYIIENDDILVLLGSNEIVKKIDDDI